jgi:multiple antibiotic resistance protein
MINDILLAFVPMFFAIDPLGILPIFCGVNQGYSKKEKTRIIIQSLITASLLAVSFIFFGRFIFKFLGIGMGDFMVAGGAILFSLSIIDLCGRSKSSIDTTMILGLSRSEPL